MDADLNVTSTTDPTEAEPADGDELRAPIFIPACFLPGTRIATPAGPVAVEQLRGGDRVLTSGGGVAPVRWLGRRRVSLQFADRARAQPVCVTAGALGERLPERDLFLSPCHGLLLDGLLVQAGALVNGITIVPWHDAPATFTYYHVELATHAMILAEGAPAESFLDTADRMAFDNWAQRPLPDRAPEPLPYPRVKSARQLPASLRRRLAARAARLAAA